jgi:sortase A
MRLIGRISTNNRQPSTDPHPWQVSTLGADVFRRPALRAHPMEHLLVGIALVALAWYTFAWISTTREQSALARELADVRIAAASSPRPGPTTGTLRVRPAPRTVIGRIEVPRLKLSVMAREGADLQTLRTAVGHLPETPLPGESGNATFAGHRDTFFRDLKGVRKGDEVVVTTADGMYRYVVTATEVVAPTETSVFASTSGHTLTLVTPYPFDYIGTAPERFIVRAEAVEPARP